MNTAPLQTKSDSRWLKLLFIVSFLTLAVHFYLTTQHYQLKMGISEGPSICNVSSTFNCDSVAVSKYATLAGIPMALLGFCSQLVFLIFLLTVAFDLSSDRDRMKRILFYFSAFVAAVSVIMGSLSAFQLGTYCLFCMATYALSAVQLLASWKIQDQPATRFLGKDLQASLSRSKWVPILLLMIPISAWASHKVILDSYGFSKLHLIVEDSVRDWQNSPVIEFKLDQGLSLQRGSAEAKMVIVEFADFLCPHCKMASAPLESFTQSHPDVRLVFKTFPLDGKCNKSIQHQGDGVRCQLAASVVCSEQLNKKGWAAHHWIFERQDKLQRDSATFIDELAKDLQLDPVALKSCLNTDSVTDLILKMGAEGSEAKIQGTPSVFVNGKLLPRGQILPVLEAAYEKLH